MKTFIVKIEGLSPLMHHRMTEEALWALMGIPDSPVSKVVAKTPRELAEKHAYKGKDGTFFIPTGYLVGAFKHVASDYKQRGSSRKTIKTIAAGVFTPTDETTTLLDNKNKPLTNFEVDIRKATNHQKGAVAVCRPRFDKWQCNFTVEIDDQILAPETALTILQDAGKRSGIGSFRVARGGNFGKFQVTEWTEFKAK